MNNECKECQYFGENFYSDDRGYNDNGRINACMLTREGYCEMSYKECHTITNCYYKQLLAEQAKNKKLEESNYNLKNNYSTILGFWNEEQAKNKKLVEEKATYSNVLEKISKPLISSYLNNPINIISAFQTISQKALNEVNNGE